MASSEVSLLSLYALFLQDIYDGGIDVYALFARSVLT
jgi:hypothetical protein